MAGADPQLARSTVLHLFNDAQVYLLLGAAITTVGLMAGCFSVLRRRMDSLVAWFALFAVLYGVRLILASQLLWSLGLHSVLLQRISIVLEFLAPIPAFLFFRSLDLFSGRGRLLTRISLPVAVGFSVAALLIGEQRTVRNLDNVFIVTAFLSIGYLLLRIRNGSPDIRLMRKGLFVFIACALFDNVTGFFGHSYRIEPFSFLVLLATLGTVAGRHASRVGNQFVAMRKELDVAQEIQLSILPPPFPASASFQVTARYIPMTAVAGDIYDFLLANDSAAGVLIADVSGHGVPAALIASMVKLAGVSQRANADQPAALLCGMNQTLLGNTQHQFVTAAYVYLDATLGELRYAAAGHPAMLLLRNREITEIVENGIPLAIMPGAAYTVRSCAIESGDRFVLYTDGILEATSQEDEEFGPERLYALLRDTSGKPQAEAVEAIVRAVQHWSATQTDDLTLILCDYHG